jgi:serine/threonine protein kinase
MIPVSLLLLLLQGCPKCLDEAQAVVRVIRPLLSALVYLHDQGIIHR